MMADKNFKAAHGRVRLGGTWHFPMEKMKIVTKAKLTVFCKSAEPFQIVARFGVRNGSHFHSNLLDRQLKSKLISPQD